MHAATVSAETYGAEKKVFHSLVNGFMPGTSSPVHFWILCWHILRSEAASSVVALVSNHALRYPIFEGASAR